MASPVGSPANQATPISQESATPEAATPNPTEAIATSEASYDNYKNAVFDITHMSDDDYVDLVVRPAIAREKIEGQLLKDVGQTAPQVHAAHILVDTKDLADTIYGELQGGANFEETAKQQSNDTATAENGGDLGWFTRGQMVKPFEDVAFSLQPGQISQPFQTQYGWHIIKVYEVDQNRAMTDQQLQQYRDSIVSRWLEERKAAMDISSKVVPTPTPAVSSFVPPPDAPPLPTETPFPPEASPVNECGTPIGGTGNTSRFAPGKPSSVSDGQSGWLATDQPGSPSVYNTDGGGQRNFNTVIAAVRRPGSSGGRRLNLRALVF